MIKANAVFEHIIKTYDHKKANQRMNDESIIKEVNKYIEAREIKFFQSEYGPLSSYYMGAIDVLEEWAAETFKNDKLNYTVLACILFELLAAKRLIDDDNIRRKLAPRHSFKEAETILKINQLRIDRDIELDEIIWYYRTSKPGSHDNNVADSNGGSNTLKVADQITIKNQELLNLFLEFIHEKRDAIGTIKSYEELDQYHMSDSSFKDSRNYFKKMAARILKMYFDNYLSSKCSPTEIYHRGGQVLDYLQLFEYKSGKKKTGVKFKEQLVSNFLSALNG